MTACLVATACAGPDRKPDTVNEDPAVAEHSEKIEKQAELNMQRDELLVKIRDNLVFDYDSSVLSDSGRDSLKEFSDLMKEYPYTAIVVKGHTDSLGDDQYNMDLATERAEVVRTVLIEDGVDPTKIQINPAGVDEPIADNSTDAGRAKNRRVELIVFS